MPPKGKEEEEIPYRCSIQNLVKFGPVDLKKMMLPDDDGPQTTAIGHLNDSGYLSTKTINKNKNPVKSRKIFCLNKNKLANRYGNSRCNPSDCD